VTSHRHTLSTELPLALRLRRAPALRSRSARGDAAAFTALYQRHHQELYRYCRAILRDDHDAQDALQSAMAKAFAALQNESRDFELRPWLFRIAHNEAISILRRRPDAVRLDAAAETGVDSLPGTVADRERLADLTADLGDLPERQRSALVLRELSGLGHEEIAQVLSSSARAVKQAIFEARTALHECAEGRDMACDEVQRVLSDADGRVLRGRRIRAHLRSCRSCRQFGAAMQTRPADLQALAAPLPVGAGAAVLAAILPAGQATVAGSAGAAGAGGALAAAGGSTGAAGGVAGAGTTAAGGAFAGVATKVAIVATVGAATVGAAKIEGVGGRDAGQRAPVTRSATPPAVPASAGGATSARRSGAPAAVTALPAVPTGAIAAPRHTPEAKAKAHGHQRPAAARGHSAAAPGRTKPAHGKHGAARGRSGSAPGHSGAARGHSSAAPGHTKTAPGHAKTAPGHKRAAPGHTKAAPGHRKGAGAAGGKPAHKAKSARPAAKARPMRAAPRARRARPRRAASVPRRGPVAARPVAPSPRPRPAQRPARVHRASPPKAARRPRAARPAHPHAPSAAAPAGSAPAPAGSPGNSASAPGHTK
jgi:RNA polymerase sigma factor (sigma-70 family)